MSDKKTALLRVDDVIVMPREVEVPLCCPRCGADFTNEGSLTLYELDSQSRDDAYLAEWPDGTFSSDWGEGDVESCEGGALHQSWSCTSCSHTLAAAKEQTADQVLQTARALVLLRAARDLLAGAPKTQERVRAAIKSCEGAKRHESLAPIRRLRQRVGQARAWVQP